MTLGAGMLLVTGPAAFAAPAAASGQTNANGGSGYPGQTVTPKDNPSGQAKGDEPGRGAGGTEHDEGCAPGHDSDRANDDGHGCGHTPKTTPDCDADSSPGRSDAAHDKSKGNGDAKSDSKECAPTSGTPGHTVTPATQADSAPRSSGSAVLGMSGQHTPAAAPALAVTAQPASTMASAAPAAVIPTVVEGMSGVRSAAPAAVIPTVVEGMSGARSAAPTAVLAAGAARAGLAFTGSATISLIAAALVLMLLGSVMVLMGRRRTA